MYTPSEEEQPNRKYLLIAAAIVIVVVYVAAAALILLSQPQEQAAAKPSPTANVSNSSNNTGTANKTILSSKHYRISVPSAGQKLLLEEESSENPEEYEDYFSVSNEGDEDALATVLDAFPPREEGESLPAFSDEDLTDQTILSNDPLIRSSSASIAPGKKASSTATTKKKAGAKKKGAVHLVSPPLSEDEKKQIAKPLAQIVSANLSTEQAAAVSQALSQALYTNSSMDEKLKKLRNLAQILSSAAKLPPAQPTDLQALLNSLPQQIVFEASELVDIAQYNLFLSPQLISSFPLLRFDGDLAAYASIELNTNGALLSIDLSAAQKKDGVFTFDELNGTLVVALASAGLSEKRIPAKAVIKHVQPAKETTPGSTAPAEVYESNVDEGQQQLPEETPPQVTEQQKQKQNANQIWWPANGRISQKASSGHPAIDIAAAAGSPVFAATNAVVTIASADYTDSVACKAFFNKCKTWGGTGCTNADMPKECSRCGKQISLQDAEGRTHLYCHLQQVLVKKGDLVKPCDKIGLVGMTGRSYGAHLHYQVKPLSDPLTLFTSSPATIKWTAEAPEKQC